MTRGINKVILLGRLGNDPELRSTAGGTPVATLSLATRETWRDKATNAVQERTEWHRVVLFARLAEIAGQYLHKGSLAYIEGALRTRKWQDTAGTDRYTTEVVVSDLQLLDPAGQHSSGASQTDAVRPAEALTDDDIPF